MTVNKLLVKGRSILGLLLIFILALSFVSCSKEKTSIELRLADFFPATHPAESVLIKQWSDEINDKTGGRVVITSYPGGTLLKAPDIYQGVVDGSADIGLSCFAYTPGRFPVMECFELPGIMYKNSQAATMTAWEGVKTLQPEELKDTKLLMIIATGPGDLFTTVPVRNLEDIKGLEIRVPGASSNTVLSLGAVPVAMDQSEVYDALQKGIVKGNLSPVEVLKTWKHGEVAKYLTRTPFLYNTLFFITMNVDKWNSLDKDLQKTITDISEKFEEEVAASLWDNQNKTALEWALNEMNIEELILSEDEAAKWIEKVVPIQDAYRQKMKEIGFNNDILQVVNQLSDKYNKK